MNTETGLPQPSRVRPLPVMGILSESIVLPAKHIKTLFPYGLPLFLLALWDSEQYQYLIEVEGASFVFLSLFLMVLFVIAITLPTVACHRVFILGKDAMKDHRIIWWSWRETKFLGRWIALVLITVVISLPVMLILILVILPMIQVDKSVTDITGIMAFCYLLGSLIAAYFFGRWSLLLPATAIDDSQKFSWAWSKSRGNGLRLMVILFLIPTVYYNIYDFLPVADNIAYSIFLTAVWIYIGAVEIACLSLSYINLVEQ